MGKFEIDPEDADTIKRLVSAYTGLHIFGEEAFDKMQAALREIDPTPKGPEGNCLVRDDDGDFWEQVPGHGDGSRWQMVNRGGRNRSWEGFLRATRGNFTVYRVEEVAR